MYIDENVKTQNFLCKSFLIQANFFFRGRGVTMTRFCRYFQRWRTIINSHVNPVQKARPLTFNVRAANTFHCNISLREAESLFSRLNAWAIKQDAWGKISNCWPFVIAMLFFVIPLVYCCKYIRCILCIFVKIVLNFCMIQNCICMIWCDRKWMLKCIVMNLWERPSVLSENLRHVYCYFNFCRPSTMNLLSGKQSLRIGLRTYTNL